MTNLTDAIKAKDTNKALQLIAQAVAKRRFRNRFYNPDAILTTPETLPGGLFLKRPYGNLYRQYQAVSRTGYDPLQLAAKNGLIEVIRALLQAGVPLQRSMPEDCTMQDFFALRHLTPALNLALEAGENAAALLLIESGADVHCRSMTDLEHLGVSYNTFGYGIYSKDVYLVYAASPMYLAAGKCSLKVMRALQERGAVVTNGLRYAHAFMDINNDPTRNYDPDKYGSTLLHAVAMRTDTDIEVISYLLQQQVELDKFILHTWRENDGLEGPIHGVYHNAVSIALRSNKQAIARLLISAGCSVFPVGFKPHHWRIQLTDLCGSDWVNRVGDNVVVRGQTIASELGIVMRADPDAPRVPFASHHATFTLTFTPASAARAAATEPLQLTAIQQELKKLQTVHDEDFLPSMICSISEQLMVDPVSIDGGNSYDRAAITRWLAVNDTDPLTGNRLRNKDIQPNLALRGAILDRIAELLAIQSGAQARLVVR